MADTPGVSTDLLEAIEQASCRQDMAKLLQCHTYDEVNAAWKHVSPIQRAALAFVRNFDAFIAHDLDDLSEPDLFPSAGQPQGSRQQQ